MAVDTSQAANVLAFLLLNLVLTIEPGYAIM